MSSLTPRPVEIVLVDDHEPSREATAEVCRAPGRRIQTFASGHEALRHLLKPETVVDVLMLDVMMPDMDGFQVASLVRAKPRFRNLPIIFITAFSRTDMDQLKGYDMGAIDYIVKPVHPDVLRAKLNSLTQLLQTRPLRADVILLRRAAQYAMIGALIAWLLFLVGLLVTLLR